VFDHIESSRQWFVRLAETLKVAILNN